jgi:hypothetical protein
MIGLLIAGYVLAMLIGGSFMARSVSTSFLNKGCHKGYAQDGSPLPSRVHYMRGSRASLRESCEDWHGEGCWRTDEVDPEPGATDYWLGVLACGVWPLMLITHLGVKAARRKPSTKTLERRIAELEAENEIGGTEQ